MTAWTDMERRLEADAAALFDSASILAVARKPGATVNHRDADDPGREGFRFVGSIEFSPPPSARQAFSQRESAGRPTVSFEAVVTAFDHGWAWAPRVKDHLVVSGVTYSIADVARDGSARRVFFLNRVST